MFDMLSVFERKNPLGAVEAFKLAFGGSSRCHLIVKVNNAHLRPLHFRNLLLTSAGYPITVLDRVMERNEVNALIACCDCLVSLHRSEGFGLPLAEGMYLGKPVIATAYGGNMDFTRPENSFLVSYKLQPPGKRAEHYNKRCLWAEPSIYHAAELMKTVFEEAGLRAEVARAGQTFVRSHHSPAAVGRLIRQRLEDLLETRLPGHEGPHASCG